MSAPGRTYQETVELYSSAALTIAGLVRKKYPRVAADLARELDGCIEASGSYSFAERWKVAAELLRDPEG